MSISIDNNVKNQGSAPAIAEGLFANRPTFGQPGRLYLATDTNVMYRDTGSAWVVFLSQVTVPSGLSPIGTAGQYIRVNAGATALEYFTFNSTAVTNALGYTPVGGTGTINNVAKFSASGTISNSTITDNGTTVATISKLAIGTAPGTTYQVEIDGGVNIATGHEYRKVGTSIFNTTNNTIPKLQTSTGTFINSTITDDGSKVITSLPLFIGSNGTGNTGLEINRTLSTGAVSTDAFGFYNKGQLTSGITNKAEYFSTSVNSTGTYSIVDIYHFRSVQGTISGATVTNQYGFSVDSTLIGATNNFGFHSNIASGTNRWNFYSAGTANNYFNGNVLIGSTTDNASGAKLQVTGNISFQNIFNRKTSSYTLVLSDQNDIIEMNVATANNLTVPLNSTVAFPIGTEIAITQYGAGKTTIVATSGVTIRSVGGLLSLSAQYAWATLVKVGTDEWYAVGSLIA